MKQTRYTHQRLGYFREFTYTLSRGLTEECDSELDFTQLHSVWNPPLSHPYVSIAVTLIQQITRAAPFISFWREKCIAHTIQREAVWKDLKPTQVTMIILCSLQSSPITFLVIYCPPNKTVSPPTFQTLFQSLGPQFIYNSKQPEFGCWVQNICGNVLFPNVLKSIPCKVLPSQNPTYWSTSQKTLPDMVDFLITRGLSHLPDSM